MIIKFADFEISAENDFHPISGPLSFGPELWQIMKLTFSASSFPDQAYLVGFLLTISKELYEYLIFTMTQGTKIWAGPMGPHWKRQKYAFFAIFKRWLWRFSTILKTFDTWQMITNRNTSKPQIMEVSKSGRGQLIRFIIPNNCKISTFQIVIKHGYNTSAHKFNNK